MRILVTGERGFIGGHVATYLAKQGHQVAFLTERIPNVLYRVGGPYEGPFDCIFHAAAAAGPWCSRGEIFDSNIAGMRWLVASAIYWKAQRFIFCSSISVYGRIEAPAVDEQTPSIDPDLYGISKMYGEALLRDSGIPTVSLRLPGVVGPGVRGKNWLPRLARAIRDRQEIEVANLDLPFNNVVHVADLAKTVAALVDEYVRGPLVLGSRDALTVREVVEWIGRCLYRPTIIREVPGTKPHFTLDPSAAIEFGVWNPMPIGELLDRFAKEVADEPT